MNSPLCKIFLGLEKLLELVSRFFFSLGILLIKFSPSTTRFFVLGIFRKKRIIFIILSLFNPWPIKSKLSSVFFDVRRNYSLPLIFEILEITSFHFMKLISIDNLARFDSCRNKNYRKESVAQFSKWNFHLPSCYSAGIRSSSREGKEGRTSFRGAHTCVSTKIRSLNTGCRWNSSRHVASWILRGF